MLNRRPNVLVLCMDQLRFDHLGCMGNTTVRTPNIDRIAARGVTFDRAYVANPLCMPARATMFTGLTPRKHGVRTNGVQLDRNIPTMPGALLQAGYHTHSVGKLHLCNMATPNGVAEEDLDPDVYPECFILWRRRRITRLPTPYFGLKSSVFVTGHGNYVYGEYLHWLEDNHPQAVKQLQCKEKRADLTEAAGGEFTAKMSLPEELHYNRYIAERTVEFLRERASDNTPFFCFTSFPDPHHPYVAPAPYCDMYDPADIPLPNRREGELADLPPFFGEVFAKGCKHWKALSGRRAPTDLSDDAFRQIIAMTYAMVSCTDAAIGLVLDALDDLGLAEDTPVCFLSDHGDMMGDHWLLNKGPFHFEGLVRMPFIWSWPGRFEEGVRTRALCGQIDFAPTILDICGVPVPEGPVPPEAEARYQLPAWPGRSLQAVCAGESDHVHDSLIIENDEDYLGQNLRTLITDRYKLTTYSHADYGELFDLEEDPDELHNLWDSAKHQPLKQELTALLLKRYLQEESPLPRRLAHA